MDLFRLEKNVSGFFIFFILKVYNFIVNKLLIYFYFF